MSQRNCHARSKQKSKQLRMEATKKRIWVDKNKRLLDAGRIEEVSNQALNAIQVQARVLEFEKYRRYQTSDKNRLNQRQKRKRWRQSPHLRLKAA